MNALCACCLLVRAARRRAKEIQDEGNSSLWQTVIALSHTSADVNRLDVNGLGGASASEDRARHERKRMEAPLPLPQFRMAANGLAELRMQREEQCAPPAR